MKKQRIDYKRHIGSGFFSNYFITLNTIMKGLGEGYSEFYVDLANSFWNPFWNPALTNTYYEEDGYCILGGITERWDINPWDWWFVQNKDGEMVFTNPVRTWEDYIPLTFDPKTFNQQDSLKVARPAATINLKIQPSILAEIDELAQSLSINENTLGVMARGTEMLFFHPEYIKVDNNSWGDIITSYLEKHINITNIFIVTDDNRILENIKEQHPNMKYLSNFFRRTNEDVESMKSNETYSNPWWIRDSRLNHKMRLGEECLIQAHLLAKCGNLIGASSGFTNAAQFFSHPQFGNSLYNHTLIF
jgi:hypothetical protein